MAWGPSDQIYQGLTNFESFFEENSRSKPAPAVDFKFVQFDDTPTEPIDVETDIVVVGSGCGGGVCAKVLAEAGHRVLVLDKGYYVPPSQLPIKADSMGLLFDRSGAMSNIDGSMLIAAGSCWGGGGTINWSVSLPLHNAVRKEWVNVHGLEVFDSSDLQNSFDRVSDFIDLRKDHTQHNHANRVLLEGSEQLGWRARTCPTNTAPDHNCGSLCASGCRESKKKGPAVNWLPAAVKAGAQCIEGFEVSEVLWEEGNGGLKRATGVVGKWTPREEDGSISATPKPENQRLVRVRAKEDYHMHWHITYPIATVEKRIVEP